MRRISVLMAAKDSQDTINIAIRTCLFALGKQDELLVFLDGCSDATSQIVDAIDDKRLRVFSSKENIGRAQARNFLLSKSLGEIIAIQDADDISLPWRFFVTRLHLIKNDAVFGNAFLFGKLPFHVPFLPLYPVALNHKVLPLVLAYRNPLVHSGSAFNREIIFHQTLYSSDVEAEEYLLWLQFANRKLKLYRTAIPLVGYRVHNSQVTSDPNFHIRAMECKSIIKEQILLRQNLCSSDRLRSFSFFKSEEDQITALRSEAIRRKRLLVIEENLGSRLRSLLRSLKKVTRRKK